MEQWRSERKRIGRTEIDFPWLAIAESTDQFRWIILHAVPARSTRTCADDKGYVRGPGHRGGDGEQEFPHADDALASVGMVGEGKAHALSAALAAGGGRIAGDQ